MFDFKSIPATSLSWEFRKKKSLLKKEGEQIFELKNGKKNRASFKSGDNSFVIRNRGFWNAETVMEQNDHEVVLGLKRLFRNNKAMIEFGNGNRYFCKTKNAVLIKLVFYSGDGKELFYFKLKSKSKSDAEFKLIQPEIPEQDLFFLIALGCFVFKGIVKEMMH